MHHHPSKTWLLALLLVPLLAMGLRLWGLNASETWDEVAYFDAAHDYYQNVLHDRWADAEAWSANREHPAVAKWLYLVPSLDAIKHDVQDFNPGRLFAALLGSLTVLLTMLLGRRLYSWRVGVLAGLTLALLPTVIGLNRVLGLDTPFTFFLVLTIWAFVQAILQGGTAAEFLAESRRTVQRHSADSSAGVSPFAGHFSVPTWSWHLIALVSFGLTLGTRLSAVLLWPILLAITLVVIARPQPWRSGTTHYSLLTTHLSSLRHHLKQPVTYLLAALYLVIPPLIVFATWPWLWHDTIAHWSITWGHWSPVATFFLGVLQEPGPGYYAIYFLASFPALFVILSILWLARAIARPTRSDLILLVWVAGVFAFSAYGLRQGGFRYLLPAVPALAIGVSAYLVELADSLRASGLPAGRQGHLRGEWPGLLGGVRERAGWLIPMLFVIYLIPHAISHQPYQLDYYNELTGGTARVAEGKWLQVGWWGEGVDEAVDWLNANAPYDANISFTALPDRAQRRLRKDFDHTAVRPQYILTNPAYTWSHPGYPSPAEYSRVYAVMAGDAPIAEVWQRLEE